MLRWPACEFPIWMESSESENQKLMTQEMEVNVSQMVQNSDHICRRFVAPDAHITETRLCPIQFYAHLGRQNVWK